MFWKTGVRVATNGHVHAQRGQATTSDSGGASQRKEDGGSRLLTGRANQDVHGRCPRIRGQILRHFQLGLQRAFSAFFSGDHDREGGRETEAILKPPGSGLEPMPTGNGSSKFAASFEKKDPRATCK